MKKSKVRSTRYDRFGVAELYGDFVDRVTENANELAEQLDLTVINISFMEDRAVVVFRE